MKGYPTYANAAEYLERLRGHLDGLAEPGDRLVEVLFETYRHGRTVFLCGNGGSAAAASHFGQDLAKGTLEKPDAQRRFRVVPLTDNVGYITALANDEGFETIFEHQLRGLGRSGDLLVAISGSGNSANVLHAVEYARSIGMRTVAVTGFDGGRLREMADVSVHVPVHDMGMAEALHGVVFHAAMSRLRQLVSESQ